MSNPLQAKYYADSATQQRVVVLQRETLARDTFRLRIAAPRLAARFLPGQFLMVRLPDSDDPLLGRAFALYDVILDDQGRPFAVDFVFLVVGKLTGRLARLHAGDELIVWGPLGNGFCPPPAEHLIMVAGGIGQTPFLALAKEMLGRQSYGQPARRSSLARQVTLCYGARTADLLAGVPQFDQAGVRVKISTDDGSRGHHGLVTDLLRDEVEHSKPSSCHVVCCGPERMMEAVSKLSAELDLPCEVSLETPMACGIGLCFSCVAKVLDDEGNWDYKRTCVEGPVFDAGKIVWA